MGLSFGQIGCDYRAVVLVQGVNEVYSAVSEPGPCQLVMAVAAAL